MQVIKKVLGAALLALGVMGLASVPSHAFVSVGVSTSTATATLTQAGTVSFSVAIKSIATNASAGSLTWTGVTLPTSWVRSDDYIALASTITAAGGGIQIYTDNTATGASPKYTGVISSTTQQTPAGLVDTTDTTKKLNTAWSVKADTTTPPTADNPNAGDPNSFQWLFNEDKAQVAVPTINAAQFVNGDPFVTVLNNSGIHFGQAPTEFGAAPSPNAVYLEADFSTAVTPRTYQTSTLRLEAFTQ